MFTDLPEAELAEYRSTLTAPADFDDFWAGTLAAARAAGGQVTLTRVDTGLTALDCFDVTFPGFGGDPVRGWLRLPRGGRNLPAVVQYVGYGGGRGHVLENLHWAAAGYAHLIMDSRGQGSGWSRGHTPDPAPTGPQVPGVMTRGIDDPHGYYYRRLFTDAVRAVDAVRTLDAVDPSRVAVVGGSQGGASALAVAALVPDLTAVVAHVPFLCDIPHALTVTDAYPYHEVVDYLATHRDREAAVLRTLSYVDGVNFASRSRTPARFSVALMDPVTPPSTVYAAYHAYAGEKCLDVWRYNGHEAGGPDDDAGALAFLRSRFATAAGGPAEAGDLPTDTPLAAGRGARHGG